MICLLGTRVNFISFDVSALPNAVGADTAGRPGVSKAAEKDIFPVKVTAQ